MNPKAATLHTSGKQSHPTPSRRFRRGTHQGPRRNSFGKKRVVRKIPVQFLIWRSLRYRKHQVRSADKAAFPRLADSSESFFAVAARPYRVDSDFECSQFL